MGAVLYVSAWGPRDSFLNTGRRHGCRPLRECVGSAWLI